MPEEIEEQALTYLDADLRTIYDEWVSFAPPARERFGVLTKYIEKLSAAAALGAWVIDQANAGTPEHPTHFPFVHYSDLVNAFVEEFYQFSAAHPGYELTRYGAILEERGLSQGGELRAAHLQNLDEQGALALLMGAIRAERFCEGALLELLEDGSLAAWLQRLKDIDRQRQGQNAGG